MTRQVWDRGSAPGEDGLIVGIGASAGALDALERLFSRMPSDSGLSFVVVQHLDRSRPSMLTELLGRHTRMLVTEAASGVRPEPNRIYVIRPNTVLTLEKGVLRLGPAAETGLRQPVDTFLRSLAEERSEDAIGIVLSGTGADGTEGLRALKAHGGLALAQSPDTARFEGMPESAIAAGLVDHILPVEEMPNRLLAHLRQRTGAWKERAQVLDSDIASSLAEICAVLQQRTGHDFGRYKEGTLQRRIRRRVLQRRSSVADYLRCLQEDAAEPQLLLRDLLISVTEFFRDPTAFQALADEVLPVLVDGRPADVPVRIWVPGCASGEEAYSIAMLVRERLERLGTSHIVQIFGTDIDAAMLEKARRGRYPESIGEQVSPQRLQRFFVHENTSFRVSDELRELCVFSPHSLIRDPPFSSLDLISCRNVLIYLDAQTQQKLIPLFHYALRAGGFLFLGPSEGLGDHPELFITVDKKHCLFRRSETVERSKMVFPLAGRTASPPEPHAWPSRPGSKPAPSVNTAFARLVFDEFAPASAVVNERGDILSLAGHAGLYFAGKSGTASQNLLELAQGELATNLRAALFRAAKSGLKVVRKAVPVEVEGEARLLRLTVQPLPGVHQDSGLFAVVLQEGPMTLPAVPETEEGEASSDKPEMAQLRSELRDAQADLQSATGAESAASQDLRAANEELISTNEELQSANEELQTSKEELQSVNEELESVNSELHEKVQEAAAANAELRNLFASSQIATIFLDPDLRIVRFTPAAKTLLHLIDTDVGRPVADLAMRFEGEHLLADAREALSHGTPAERQVHTADGTWFIKRVLPYRNAENAIAGASVTFIDVTELHKAGDATLRYAELLHLSHDAVFVWRLDAGIESWNRGAEELFGFQAAEALGKTPHALLGTVFPSRWPEIEAALRSRERWEGELRHTGKDGQAITVLTNLRLVRGNDGIDRVLESSRDITERKLNEEALRRAEAEASRRASELSTVFDALAHPVLVFDVTGRVLRANPAAQAIFGEDPKGADADRYLRLVQRIHLRHADGRQVSVDDTPSRRALGGELLRRELYLVTNATGDELVFEISAVPIASEGRIAGAVLAWHDVTARKQMEEVLREGEERFRTMAESIPQLAWIARADGFIYWYNQRWYQYTGTTPAQMEGWGWQSVHDPEVLPQVLERWQACIASGQLFDMEFPLRGADGRFRRFLTRVMPVRDSLGRVVQWFGTNTDVTELAEANRALQEADRNRNQFLAMLSHELRNPLAPIRNSLFILGRATPGGEQAQRAQTVIDRQVGHMARLVDDLLDVTRVSRGKIQLQRERVELRELMSRTIEDHRSVFEKSGVELEIELPEQRIQVDGDRTRLAQIVGNLLSNAAKFTDRGGRVRIAMEYEPRSARAIIRVEDNGVGIDAAMLSRLFEPFLQADHSLDRSKGGLGLGLALVKALVEIHGGTVEAKSDGQGKGTEFVVSLPVQASEEPKAALPDRREPGPRARRILVIEDNVDSADSLREALELGGHVVAVANSGLDGLELARQFAPDVVLCDIGLPGMDGYEVARAMRADPLLRKAFLVALTGYAAPEDTAKAKEAGFDRHLAKPPRLEEIGRALAGAPGTPSGAP